MSHPNRLMLKYLLYAYVSKFRFIFYLVLQILILGTHFDDRNPAMRFHVHLIVRCVSVVHTTIKVVVQLLFLRKWAITLGIFSTRF